MEKGIMKKAIKDADEPCYRIKSIETVYMGIDPGKNGGLALLVENELELYPIPLIHNEVDWKILLTWSHTIKRNYPKMIIVLEKVHSIFGSSAGANFTFGGVYFGLMVICTYLNKPLHHIQPKTWQKVMFEGVPIKYKTGKKSKDTKAMALLAARNIFPGETFLKTTRCSKPHDGFIDAALMAKYAQMKLK
jgi:hypothetical protein